MAFVIAHAELVLDQTNHARTGPQRRREAVRLGAFEQQRFEAFELRGVQQRLAAGAAGGAEPGLALLAVASSPLTDGLAGDFQPPGGFGLIESFIEQAHRFEAAFLERFEIAALSFCCSLT